MRKVVSQATLMQKWSPILEVGEKIESRNTKKVLAQLLENTATEFERNGLLTEATSATSRASVLGPTPVDGKNSTGFLKGQGGREGVTDYGNFYLPNVIMPMVRRIFPSLIAHELVGVQALNQPTGYALAYRAKYGSKNQGYNVYGAANGNKIDENPGVPYGQLAPELTAGAEIGFNPVDTRYTGTATTATSELTSDALTSYFGTQLNVGDNHSWLGEGKATDDSEFASFSQGTYPTVAFDFLKTMVEAKTRKLGAGWSPELAEDMKAMHGFDVESEFVNMISFEIGAEIDRQLVTEMVRAAVMGGSISKWSPAEADGLDQMGRLATLLTQVTIEANQIAIRTRRGHANFVITSPRVTALLEQLSMNKFVNISNTGKDAPSVPDSGVGALTKCGLINDGQQLLVRDTYATGDYVLMGYKGAHPADNGIIYCPYIPVQLQKVINPDTLTPVIGARTRYGVMNSVWDAKNYYHFISIAGLTDSYQFNAERRFIQPYTKVDNGTIFA